MAARPTVVLTRPHTEALQWQQQLQALGQNTVVLPLIEIAPAQDAATRAALEAIRQQLGHYRALMFVSPNAVRGFMAAPGMAEALAQALRDGTTRCWAPGPGTHKALQAAGVPDHAIDSPAADAAQFDSESLWDVVAPQIRMHDRVLIVRGASQGVPSAPSLHVQGSGREWLSRQLQAQGAQVTLVGVYARQCPPATPALLTALTQHVQDPATVWLFSSSEAIAHLQQLMPTQSFQHQRALTTHPRIAEAAHAAGFGNVQQCKPGVVEVCASIESGA